MTVEQTTVYEKLNRRIVKSRGAVLLLLSVFLITGVFWWLKLVGITIAGEAFCGIDEHSHTAECLAEGCDKTEHTHVDTCYSNPDSDVETERDWESTVSGVQKTGIFGRDLVAIAESQLGYAESKHNFVPDAQNVRRGYTRYGAWHGNPHGEWSAMFVSFCLYYADITESLAPYNSGAEAMRAEWANDGMYRDDGFYTPLVGDLVFLDRDENGVCDAVGILCGTDGNSVTSIEGDLNDTVAKATYHRTDPRVKGYGVLNEVVRKTATETDLAYTEYVTGLVDELPSNEEIESTLLSLEDDMDAYETYFENVAHQIKSAYIFWEDLLPKYRVLVENSAKLEELNWTWMVSRYVAVAQTGEYTVIQVNRFWHPDSIAIFYGKTADDIMKDYAWANESGSYFRFHYWYAYVIEENSQTGGLYVDTIYLPDGSDKGTIKASTSNGFVCFVHPSDGYNPNIKVGDSVYTSSAYGWDFYKNERNDANGVGKLVFGTSAKISYTDTTPFVNVVQNVPDTGSMIEINLFDYGASADGTKNINTMYYSNNAYPGFQRPSIGSSYNEGDYAFGDIVISDFGLTNFAITGSGTGINDLLEGYEAKRPLEGQMWTSLNGGYPTIPGITDLGYLFSPGEYVYAMNDKNITGLFQYNPTTEMYYYDSRQNHAQFDAETDRFILYEETITPNFVMYPFGNFMPFNTITYQATPVLQRTSASGASYHCNEHYFRRCAASAMGLYHLTRYEEYKRLSDFMEGFGNEMTNNGYTGDWTAWDVMQRYMDEKPTSSATAQGTLMQLVKDKGIFDKLFNIDFDERSNFFFGMDIHYDFFQPKDGLVGTNDDKDMVFDFAGDDDVWIYIDSYLFLDLSGIHSQVGGKIDFRRGLVSYYEFGDFSGAVSSTPYKTETFRTILYRAVTNNGMTESQANAYVNSRLQTVNVDGVAYETFKDYSDHTFDFYYMERGSGSSICSINFNLPILEKNRIEIEKVVDGKTSEMLGDPDYLFMVVNNNDGDPNRYGTLVPEGTEYKVYDSESMELVATRSVEPGGIIRCKANQTAIVGGILENAGSYYLRELFELSTYQQYLQASITGAYTETVLQQDFATITVAGKQYMALIGGYTDASSGNAHFVITNKLDATKVSSLQISKIQKDYSADATVKEFTFDLLFDGVPVAAGTPYTIITQGGTSSGTVTAAGKLTFRSDQSVRFDNLFAGTQISLRETDGSSAGYVVTYEMNAGTDFAVDGTGALVGSVKTNASHAVVVTNDAEGVKLELGGTKTLLCPDGAEHSYTFDLHEIVSDTSNNTYTLKSGGIHLRSTVTLDGTAVVPFAYTLNFPSGTDKGVTHYFRIIEDGADKANGGDTTWYLLAVNFDIGGNPIGTLFKNGTGEIASQADFVNYAVRSLTVSKTVEGSGGTTGTFTFEITAQNGGTPLVGTYPCTGAVGEVTFDTSGRATVELQHGQTVTVLGLPFGTAWTVTEQAAAGYYTQHTVDGGERTHGSTASGTLGANTSVAYYNVGGAELPATGGFMRNLFPTVGGALMLLACVLAIAERVRRIRLARA